MLGFLNDLDRAIVADVEGSASFIQLREGGGAAPPSDAGVYFVLLPDYTPAQFVAVGTGGFFKGKDPNVSVRELQANSVPGTRLLYIGKAGGAGSQGTLRNRIMLLSRFGQGKAVGHYGGRYLWQVAGSESLIVAWRRTPGANPQEVESSLIREFVHSYEQRPFANLIG